MGKITGFLETPRAENSYAPVAERLKNYREFSIFPEDAAIAEQGGRCMDCGIPFCLTGCPVNNIIPDWNDLVYRGDWRRAAEVLHSTNNFPEFTGRVCPAPCEEACTLNINDDPVTIKSVERAIVDRAWREGWLPPKPAARQTGKTAAIVGSGPAGLACAQQLARCGHAVTVFEKNEQPGGLLRYGIPDFKMEKSLIDRRITQMREEGVSFQTGARIGGGDAAALLEQYDAIVLCGGCEHPRDLKLPGRDLRGVHFAMEYLPQQNRRVAGLPVGEADILAAGKHVVVIGGGDTGSDCIGTANRQGAAHITQFELLSRPPDGVDKMPVWPDWPMKMRTSTSHDEGCERQWSVLTKAFLDDGGGRVQKLRAVRLEWTGAPGSPSADGKMTMQELPDGEFEIRADLVLLAMGYVHPAHDGLAEALSAAYDQRGNIAANDADYRTSSGKVFAAGDMRRGQSLVVWAIREGRQCAHAVDKFLLGETLLPRH